jgi:hypothetical protein
MSKKKNKAHPEEFLAEIDESLDRKYLSIIEEIQFMQADLKREERKAKKKAKRQLKKGGGFYSTAESEKEIRRRLVYEMEGTNFFDRVTDALNDLLPVCSIIAKLVMSLIVAILSIDSVKYQIKPATLQKMNTVYGLARNVSVAGR